MLQDNVQEQLAKMRREAEERDAQRRASGMNLEYLPPHKAIVNLEALELLPEADARDGSCAPIAMRDKKLAVAAYDPESAGARKAAALLKERGYDCVFYIVSLSTMAFIMTFYRYADKERVSRAGAVHVGDEGGGLSFEALDSVAKVHDILAANNDSGKVSHMIQIILMGAIANRASDIHLEPAAKSAKLRYRIDGLLHDVYVDFSASVFRLILSRFKLLSNLKINIRDEAQDGRFTISFPKKANVEVRVAIAPSEFGEVIVMRLLDPDAINVGLPELGLRGDDLAIVEEQLKRPNGMALNTGPTGSGKTTTLYAFLKHRLSPEIKIITIEDPIEYHLEGIEQTQVEEESNYTFANGLRSLMRQDPDVILVGEIRDKETAEIAIQAALTGHLVFSTVHANEAAGGIARLLDLGARPNSVSPALNLLIAQRLVRRLCPACREAVAVPEQMKKDIEAFVAALPPRVDKAPYGELSVFRAKGCDRCNGSGYRGRIGIYELLVLDDEVRELISRDAGQIEINRIAKKKNFVSMQQDGILKAISGVTTFEEVEDVTGKIEWEAAASQAEQDAPAAA
jgi:type II secretory ATPase GspE/PulE/Tfp pilus assembly ATPase PilB-like protein